VERNVVDLAAGLRLGPGQRASWDELWQRYHLRALTAPGQGGGKGGGGKGGGGKGGGGKAGKGGGKARRRGDGFNL